jgi:hypothetical protein
MDARSFLTVKQFAEKHSAFTTGSLRWLIFSNPKFNTCVRRIGRKVLIAEHDALNWFDQQRA